MEKKTFVVDMGGDIYIKALMRHMEWNEVDRVASGGYMSSNHLMLTFEGDPSKYNEDLYLVSPRTDGGFNFYSVLYPDGYYMADKDEKCVLHFKEAHDKRKTPDFEVKQFQP